MDKIQSSMFFLRMCLGPSCNDPQIEVIFWNARILSIDISQERTVAEIDVTINHSKYLPSLKWWKWLIGTEFAVADHESKTAGASVVVTLICPAKWYDTAEISVSADDGENWSRIAIDEKSVLHFCHEPKT